MVSVVNLRLDLGAQDVEMSSLADGRFVAVGVELRPTKLLAHHHLAVFSSLIIV